MNVHIYAFGSVCRGEIEPSSDIDMLAIVNGRDERFNPSDYSIYSYTRIDELWREGNPFAWHLYLESKLIFTPDKIDHLRNIGEPSTYKSGIVDCEKFREIFLSAVESLGESNLTEIFDLSSVFLAIRNFATCYSLHANIPPDFSRNSACNLGKDSIPIDDAIYHIYERARVLCTRGVGDVLTPSEITKARVVLGQIDEWMKRILITIKSDGYE